MEARSAVHSPSNSARRLPHKKAAYLAFDLSDERRAQPSPLMAFQRRILEQSFQYDWLGNNEKTGDDANGFYDRSLGDIENDSQKPYQLTGATSASGASDSDDSSFPGVSSNQTGSLQTKYDAAGSMVGMSLSRNGTCLGGAASDCSQRFVYNWDEVGRMVRARRWDGNPGSVDDPVPSGTPAADLRNTYDASDQRVIKEAVDAGGNKSYTLYIFASLELRRTQYGAGYGTDGSSDDFEVSIDTVVPYLMANGVRLARLVHHADGVPTEAIANGGGPGEVNASTSQLHVFFELGDHLGSTSVVLDKATGELVERATFQAYGGAESDYRPDRWKSFREDYRFTGKEEDVEVGLQYFGKRFLNPLLGRWISADPLAVHAPGEADLNLYAYVEGSVLKSVDPLGLDGVEAGWRRHVEPFYQSSKEKLHQKWSEASKAIRHAPYNLADWAGKGPGRSVCQQTPTACKALAKFATGSGYWQQRLLSEYTKGGDPNRTLRLNLYESRDWMTRQSQNTTGPFNPFVSSKANELWNQKYAELKKSGAESITFRWKGSTYQGFDGPGTYRMDWDVQITITKPKGQPGDTTTYAGTAKISDRWDFDPKDPDKTHRPTGAEFKTRLGQAVPGNAFNIESGTLIVHGTDSTDVQIDGEVPPPPKPEQPRQGK